MIEALNRILPLVVMIFFIINYAISTGEKRIEVCMFWGVMVLIYIWYSILGIKNKD